MAKEASGIGRMGAGAGRTHRATGSTPRNLAWILWAGGALGLKRWGSHQAAG